MISKCERCGSLSISEGHVVKICGNLECGIDGMQMAEGALSFYMTDGAIVRWDSEKHGKFLFSSPSCRDIWAGMIAQAWADVRAGLTRWIHLGDSYYVKSMVFEEKDGLQWYSNTSNYKQTNDDFDVEAAKRFSDYGLWGPPQMGGRGTFTMVGIYFVPANRRKIMRPSSIVTEKPTT